MVNRLSDFANSGELKRQIADWERRYTELLQHIERLELRLSQAEKRAAAAERRVQQLQEELRGAKKDSGNSSKPPSSDIVKPPKKNTRGKRRRGGQEGHTPQQRTPFAPDQIEAVERHAYAACPQCGGPVEPLLEPAQVLQQVELVTKPILVTEHLSCTCRCHACQADFTKPIAPQVAAAGLCGPRLTTLIAYLKGACHASYCTIQQFLRETCGLALATGTLVKACQKVARSLQPSYDQLRQQIPREMALNIDETSHRENGAWHWTWVFRAPRFTLFHIDPTRSTQVLNQMLGSDFAGTLMADYYSAYRSYLAAHPQADAQFCLAHLIRDVKFLGESLAAPDRQFAGELLGELTELFRLWHASQDAPEDAALRAALVSQGQQLERVATEQAPATQLSRKVAQRFRKHGPQYLRFTQQPGLEPTNNAAEQALRQVVIDRKVTQGTRSPRGRDWCQRIWTALATCRQQHRDVHAFLEQSLLALLGNTPPPSLLASPSR
jgi:transposase